MDAIDHVTLGDEHVTVKVLPQRGGLVAELIVRGVDVLYLDPATLFDPTKNVRGGIPVLFPFAGKLDNGTLALTGTKMAQHGFGRNKPWQIADGGSSWFRMTLAADADTRAQFPYEFTAEQTVRALQNGVQLELAVTAGAKAVPVSPGWHPYFKCAPADKASIDSDLDEFDTGSINDTSEPDFGLTAPSNGRARFDIPGLGPVRLEFSPDMHHLQCWSQPGKPFVCIEPFFGPAGTINSERRGWVQPNETRTFWMRIELDEPPHA
jgi:galactose mutarotase-like enzyme